MYKPYIPPSPKSDETDLFYIFIIVVFIGFTIVYFVVISRYSGSAQWALVLILVAVSALIVLRFVKTRLKKLDVLSCTRPEERGSHGELGELREALRRADSGSRHSQLLVKERFIRIFLDKIRSENNLSLREMESLRDIDMLRRFVQDRELFDFAGLSINELNDWHNSLNKEAERDFLKNMDIMVKKMEV